MYAVLYKRQVWRSSAIDMADLAQGMGAMVTIIE